MSNRSSSQKQKSCALTTRRYPSPTSSYVKIRCGYVGFVVRGRFELLFDSNGPLGSRVLGRDVPLDFEPLPEVATQARSQVLPPRNLVVEGKREFGMGVQATSCAIVSVLLASC